MTSILPRAYVNYGNHLFLGRADSQRMSFEKRSSLAVPLCNSIPSAEGKSRDRTDIRYEHFLSNDEIEMSSLDRVENVNIEIE